MVDDAAFATGTAGFGPAKSRRSFDAPAFFKS